MRIIYLEHVVLLLEMVLCVACNLGEITCVDSYAFNPLKKRCTTYKLLI